MRGSIRKRDRARGSLAITVRLVCMGLLGFGLLYGALWLSAFHALAPLREAHCAPLRVHDRHGARLRVLPAACGHRGRAGWAHLSEMPQSLVSAVLASEDRRFMTHPGVDPLAIARALATNLRAGRVVSGASTLTMQLMRMLHHPHAPRSLRHKLSEAWLSLSAERVLDKHAILEAYLNHAYYGHGSYGAAAAAERYFHKSLTALTDGEATLLSVLPRAPIAYDPVNHLSAARARRDEVLAMLVANGQLSAARAAAIAVEPLHVKPRGPRPADEAPHFVNWAVASLPAGQRRAGGALHTTLDLRLQRQLELAVTEHVRALEGRAIADAGLVVLDAATSEVRAWVGSADFEKSQIDLVVRRRHPGSLLKPFVYALALEQGHSPSRLVYDVGDVPSAFRSRDWVGREGGPLPMAEALAGSYNLAAVHLLEAVGVETLRDRLRRIGVAEAKAAPDRYGLSLALGATRVRLLDVTAGFGFLVRDGRVRRPVGIASLVRHTDRYRPRSPNGQRAFSPGVAWLVMDMLSRPAARHGRFGLGLPVDVDLDTVDAAGGGKARARIVAKTGTASGMADVTTVLASREFLVGVWAGRLDGKPTRGMSGMWGAAPLARKALDIALAGSPPSLPSRPPEVVRRRVCAVSGMVATSACPTRRDALALSHSDQSACTWHQEGGDPPRVPEPLHDWLARARAQTQAQAQAQAQDARRPQ